MIVRRCTKSIVRIVDLFGDLLHLRRFFPFLRVSPNGTKSDIQIIERTVEAFGECSSVSCLEGENQVSNEMEQSACHRTVPRCSVRLPKVTELEDAEGQSKRAMELTKGRIAEWIGDPDLLRRLVLPNIFLATINTYLNS
uniref:Uncharacterized protein n=1 Tax=Solanum tuberosum TaxID=4113 RepID=M1DDP2_SOLTU